MCTAKVCINDDIRLVDGGVSYEGRVEYCRYGDWGTVCDDDWTALDATVACSQLGYSHESEFNTAHLSFVALCLLSATTITGAVAFVDAAFGQGSGVISLADVECNGTERSLDECSSSDVNDYSYMKDAGVRCIGK